MKKGVRKAGTKRRERQRENNTSMYVGESAVCERNYQDLDGIVVETEL